MGTSKIYHGLKKLVNYLSLTVFDGRENMKNKQLLAEIERIIRRHLGDAEFLRRVYAALTMLEDTMTQQSRGKQNRR